MVTAEYIRSEAQSCGMALSEEKAGMLCSYAEAVEETNRHFNLTAITSEEEFVTRHIIDSLFCAERPEIAGKVADVGTGAGFPGSVIGIVRDVELTLIEATEKKLDFAIDQMKKFGRTCCGIHSRAEDAARTELRESFDCVVSRGVASLPVLLEYCVPLVRKGGYFIAMKGEGAYEEERTETSERLLGVEIAEIVPYVLRSGIKHELVIYKKTKKTDDRYPRRGDRIRKSPL